MRKLLAVVVALSSVLGVSVANAEIVLVDDFNEPSASVRIRDIDIGGTAPSMTAVLASPSLALNRTVSVDLSSKASFADPDAGISATAGGGANGTLNISVDTGTNGTATVKWTIPAFTLGFPAAYNFDVIFSGQGSTNDDSVPNNIDFSFVGNTAGHNFTLANQTVGAVTTPVAKPFALDATQASYLSGGGVLAMTLSGGAAWHLVLDSFSITVPEPTSLALVGLALVGAGFAASRRKA
jgi:hypothetical protein